MDYKNLIAIDIHTHAEVSCRNPFDNYGEEYDRAADKFFGSNNAVINLPDANVARTVSLHHPKADLLCDADHAVQTATAIKGLVPKGLARRFTRRRKHRRN
jgi:hypothetical protein